MGCGWRSREAGRGSCRSSRIRSHLMVDRAYRSCRSSAWRFGFHRKTIASSSRFILSGPQSTPDISNVIWRRSVYFLTCVVRAYSVPMRVLLMAALLRKDEMGRLLLWACLGALPVAALADEHEMLCSDGFGSFTSRFVTGVTVTVEPVRKSAFASRVCTAALSWKSGELAVSPKASEI